MSARVARTLLPSLVLVLFLGGVLLLGSWAQSRGEAAPPLNGDSVGIEEEESYADYQARAAASLKAASAEEPSYALVVFRDWLDPEQAGDLVEPLARVSAEVVDAAHIAPLPEPVAGATRAEVLNLGMERTLAEHRNAEPRLSAVVVRDTGDALREWAAEHEESLTAVDVLPADAVWGFFGITFTLPMDHGGE
ncbi:MULTISPECIES: hypothetical protein [unclassified Corynebacterium]|uniref:hypothetical protein n=1 Tax=unclassified Corynebacterium TaxID=2624378 RepID=UPI0029CA43C3|nr:MULTISPECIES: hypothetical protein [unclassified Corynebacterium]WPF65411.1 hypothetical protein OLX12_07450 [Corynebacterium sp. 22KM0430]WPF67906.1 hypothetical protein OLW90_07440 [Corynebacterium sp. 21KM1197]